MASANVSASFSLAASVTDHGTSPWHPSTFDAMANLRFALQPAFFRIFFGLCACSWMPHWACHYYRLETGSSFVVGPWAFSIVDSIVSLCVYTVLIVLNLAAIELETYRVAAAGVTGIGHLAIGCLHVYRLIDPFTFEVFGYSWRYGASLREALAVIPIGLVASVVAISLKTSARRHRAR